MLRRSLMKSALFGASALAIAACAPAADEGPGDIVDVAAANGSFNTLVAAVTAADLVDTLKSDGPFTVFAPTDDAFAALPAGTVENLLLPENKDQLVQILTYHVVPGRIAAADIPASRIRVATVEGSSLHIDGRDSVKVENANVIIPDVAASNGVIHVIDAVLLP
ncbi:MAG: fasciclin domain-containing protein [Pseudomonadota bacterium]